VRHSDNKFDYDNEGIAHRRHIIADRIRFIGKESNNIDEASVFGIDEALHLLSILYLKSNLHLK